MFKKKRKFFVNKGCSVIAQSLQTVLPPPPPHRTMLDWFFTRSMLNDDP